MFIARSREKYGDRFTYEYSRYIGSLKPIIVTCKIHGPFVTTPTAHNTNKIDCPHCAYLADLRPLNVVDGKKQCTKCGRWLERTEENFNRCSKVSDGLNVYCKTCSRELGRQQYQKKDEYAYF